MSWVFCLTFPLRSAFVLLSSRLCCVPEPPYVLAGLYPHSTASPDTVIVFRNVIWRCALPICQQYSNVLHACPPACQPSPGLAMPH